jgi:hypothetical protein
MLVAGYEDWFESKNMHKYNSQLWHSSPSPLMREVETVYETLTTNSIFTSRIPQGVMWWYSFLHSRVNWRFLCRILVYHSGDYVYLFNNRGCSCMCCSHHSKLTRLSQPFVVYRWILCLSHGWFFLSKLGGPSHCEVLSYSLLSLCLNPELVGGFIVNVLVQ